MNWRKLFPVGDIFPTADRKELEKISESCAELRKWEQKVLQEWPKDSSDRENRLRELGAEFAKKPNRELYDKLTTLAGFPTKTIGWGPSDIVLGALHREMDEMMKPEIPVVRRVLSRALEATERELEKQTAKEKKEASSEGFTFSPSGRVLDLQNRVLDLRNQVSEKYPGEGAVQHPGHWESRLADYL